MSASRDINYKCPYCGKEFTITIYDSVNGTTDPDLRDRCLSGDIFRHSCPHCHKDFMIQNELVYMDPEHKFVIMVSSKECTTKDSPLFAPLKKKGYVLRRCPTVEEFIEKIQILEDGVSDVAVELAKYDSFIEYIDNRKGNPEDITSIEYGYMQEDVMKINVRADDRSMSFLIPMQGLEEEIRAEQDLYTPDDVDFPCVNRDWIISLFTPKSGEA